jgi:hypothetical protein
MSAYGWRIDSFSGALGDLPKKAHGDDAAVLAVLAEHPRFSVWDVSTTKLGKTLDRLTKAGRLQCLNDAEQYPWCRVAVLPPPTPCVCEGKGYFHIIGRHYQACPDCHGRGWLRPPTETRGTDRG